MGCSASKVRPDRSKSYRKNEHKDNFIVSTQNHHLDQNQSQTIKDIIEEQKSYLFEVELENFVQMCIYQESKTNAMKVFLNDPGALIAFIKYLKKDDQFHGSFHSDNIHIFQESIKASAEYSETKVSFEKLIEKYLKHKERYFSKNEPYMTLAGIVCEDDHTRLSFVNHKDNDHHKTVGSINHCILNDFIVDHDIHQFNLFQSDEILLITAVKLLPIFLVSYEYIDWRNSQEALNGYANGYTSLLNQTYVKLLESTSLSSEVDEEEKDINNNSNCATMPNATNRNIYIQRALAVLNAFEFKNISKSRYLSTLLGVLEHLPICISLATASPTHRGFPLIYVNSMFEQTTGYSRKDIIGCNCNFLQRATTEDDSMQLLSYALKNHQSIHLLITNYRKNGERFKNLLAMKPLFDADGVYSYVIGCQFDISKTPIHFQNLQFIHDFFGLLPDKLPRCDN